jgi:hypothetical protein
MANTIGTLRVICSKGATAALPFASITPGASATIRCVSAKLVGVGTGPAGVDLDIAPNAPAQLLQPLCKSCDLGLRHGIAGRKRHQYADQLRAFAPLRARRDRPRRCRAAK